MATDERYGSPWSANEIALIVADYFAMLRMELAGEYYVKAHRNAALQELTGRSKGSIERKHQNISAILQELCAPWVSGYKPLGNYQDALAREIEQVLDTQLPWQALQPAAALPGVADVGTLFMELPPARGRSEAEPPAGLQRLIRKFDFAAVDARNRDLGRFGEELVVRSEFARLKAAGRGDLARRVDWVADRLGDGAGYDVLSFDIDGGERLLEVKTTGGHAKTPFFLSENERALSDERPKAFRLVRLYDARREPRAFELVPPLSDHVLLKPTSYRASF